MLGAGMGGRLPASKLSSKWLALFTVLLNLMVATTKIMFTLLFVQWAIDLDRSISQWTQG